jgi:hypothetical protein
MAQAPHGPPSGLGLSHTIVSPWGIGPIIARAEVRLIAFFASHYGLKQVRHVGRVGENDSTGRHGDLVMQKPTEIFL